MAILKLFSVTVLAASALAISSPAMADSTPAMANEKTKLVRYNDLDLSLPQDQTLLQARVKRAAKVVCRSPRAMTAKDLMDQHKCELNAMARAMPKAKQAIAAYIENRRFASKDSKAIVGN